MFRLLKKRYIIPSLLCVFLYIGSGFGDDFFEIAKQLEIFTSVFKEVNKNYVDQTNPSDLMNRAIRGALTGLDPYSVFFDEQEAINFKIDNTGDYTGVGAVMTRQLGKLIIKEIYKDSPADKAKLKIGDEIIQINDIVLSDFKSDVSQLFKGAKNTAIDIKYLRQEKSLKTQIILDEVEIKAVPFFAKIDDKTGYIILTNFNKKASIETKTALERLKADGAKQIILDLRDNPGGLLTEAVAICNLFVPKKEVIVTTKSRISKYNSTYTTTNDPFDTEIPLAILINKKSASASEIVSGALQDLDRAVIIGERSFGKGLVQKPIDLTYGTQLKITISRYYIPSGRCIQALDYSRHKRNDSKAVFKTKNGRTVYDGGGILPDISLEETKLSSLAEALEKNEAIFNFATHYYHKNPTLDTPISAISDADYADFKHYLKTTSIPFDTETQTALKTVLVAAQKDKISENIIIEYQQLLTAIEKSESVLLDKNQKEIKNLILKELIKRYSYKEGVYLFNVKNDIEIKRAIELFNNTSEYKSVLKK